MEHSSIFKELNQVIKEKNPETINTSWIINNTPRVYRYIHKNIRLDTGGIDWDSVTSAIDRGYQKRWTRYRYRHAKTYSRQSEVDAILVRYKDKLYTFIAPADEHDKHIQDRMIIRLVRLGQRGNVCAQEELIKWVGYLTDDWIDRHPVMYRWRGYEDEIPDKIRACIRCYRYTGSFLGYLYKTLEYSVRGKPPLCSLDDKIFDGTKTRIDFVRIET